MTAGSPRSRSSSPPTIAGPGSNDAWPASSIRSGVPLQLVIVDDASTRRTSEWLGTLDDARVTAISLRQN